MDLTYKVPRDAYIELLVNMIRRNQRRPIRMLTFFLLTAGQLAAVTFLCIFRLEHGQRIFFLVWSVLLAALTVLRRRTVRLRAKGTLQRLEYTGQLSEDFWKEHKLQTENGELLLHYGAQKLSCPLSNISHVEEKTHALHLYCGETMFDIVPESAFRNREAMLKFAQTLGELAVRTKAPTVQCYDTALNGLFWRMEERAFEDGQNLAYRMLYYRYRFLRPATFVRLTVSVLAITNLIRAPSSINIALGILLLALANLENISMIPFICRLRIRREMEEWRGSGEYRLSLCENTVVFASDRAEVGIPIQKINLCEKIGPYFVIAWSSFPAVVLPAEALQTPEGAALTQQINTLYQRK